MLSTNRNEQITISQLPPSHAIVRENHIKINLEEFNTFFSRQLNPSHPKFQEYLNTFLVLMNKIRLAVQSNLGLSATDRDKHETLQPIWVKIGEPNFDNNQVIFDATPTVQIMSNHTNDGGISFRFQTKYRKFTLYIDEQGKVISSLKLNWNEIFESLSSDAPEQQNALRSFTSWQRHSESNFFNGRSTNKVLLYLAEMFPSIFSHDATEYYRDQESEFIEVSQHNINYIKSNNSNLYLQIDESLLNIPDKIMTSINQPMLAVVRRKSPLLGTLIQLAPVIFEHGKIHIVLHGHQQETVIEKLLICDFDHKKVESFQLKKGILKIVNDNQNSASKWTNLHLLKHEYGEILKQTVAAPMVRASDAVMRKYWNGCYDIPTVYSEMITIADIFNSVASPLTPQQKLESLYYSDAASSSFRRLILSEYELIHAKHLAIQLVVPHDSVDEMKYWRHAGENIQHTINLAAQVLQQMIPPAFHHKIRLAINMCCPAASVERTGGGFGLSQKPEYVASIIQATKEKFPGLHIEFKTLMLSEKDTDISISRNQQLAEQISKDNGDRLVWQAKPRNVEKYDLARIANISKSAKVNKKLNFGYSGMVATLTNHDLFKLGF